MELTNLASTSWPSRMRNPLVSGHVPPYQISLDVGARDPNPGPLSCLRGVIVRVSIAVKGHHDYSNFYNGNHFNWDWLTVSEV